MERYKIRYLFGYTSALHALAQGAASVDFGRLELAVAITNAEPVLDYQREAIAGAFACPVRETYGMSEIVAAAGECEAGRLHLWPEVGWLEVREGTDPVSRGRSGEFISTGTTIYIVVNNVAIFVKNKNPCIKRFSSTINIRRHITIRRCGS